MTVDCYRATRLAFRVYDLQTPHMTADQFQTLAIGWCAAIGVVAAVAIPLYFKIAAQIAENKGRIDQHDQLKGVKTTGTTVSAAPPPINVQLPSPSTITRPTQP